MFYEDFSYYQYCLKSPLLDVQNIGWIEKGKPYKTGSVSRRILPKLSSVILGNSIFDAQVNRMRSAHSCNICGCSQLVIEDKEKKDILGAAEIWIPSYKNSSRFFAFPSMVYHYIDKHGYLPPKEFLNSIVLFDINLSYSAQEVYLSKVKGHF